MKVAVLMSGGIDSSVVACLLQEQGHEVMGLTMVNWDESVGEKAAKAAASLGIEHRIVDLRREFDERVVGPFCRAYESARTPNPCVACNKFIKFGRLLDIAMEYGCEKVATGHYVQVEYDELRDRYLLKRGRDEKKDQSYFLYILTQQQLAHACFPLGTWTKEEVRTFASQRGMPSVKMKESQEICFIADDYRNFISGKVACQSGEFIDQQDNVVGRHRGLPYYTIGQRKGLGISGGKPLYVLDMNLADNTVLLGDNVDLFRQDLLAEEQNFIFYDYLIEPMKVQAKIRYGAQATWATITPAEDGRMNVHFEEAQRAITPGQAVVFYLDDYVLGGGTIV